MFRGLYDLSGAGGQTLALIRLALATYVGTGSLFQVVSLSKSSSSGFLASGFPQVTSLSRSPSSSKIFLSFVSQIFSSSAAFLKSFSRFFFTLDPGSVVSYRLSNSLAPLSNSLLLFLDVGYFLLPEIWNESSSGSMCLLLDSAYGGFVLPPVVFYLEPGFGFLSIVLEFLGLQLALAVLPSEPYEQYASQSRT